MTDATKPVNAFQVRSSPVWADALRIASENGYVKMRDLLRDGLGQRRICQVLTKLVREGKLFPRDSGGHGRALYYFQTEESAAAFMPNVSPRAIPKEAKPRGRPKSQEPKPPKPPKPPKIEKPRGRPITIMQPIGNKAPGFTHKAAKPSAPQIVIGLDKPPTICPVGLDQRFTVRELPAGYVSQLSAAECRPWAAGFGERG